MVWNTDPALHQQLQILKEYIHGFDFVKMRPDTSVIKGGLPDKATARALVEKGEAYAIYINGGSKAKLQVELPKGQYRAEWVHTKTGKADRKETFDHTGGIRTLVSPGYQEDIALKIQSNINN